jgi:hypothetical protein
MVRRCIRECVTAYISVGGNGGGPFGSSGAVHNIHAAPPHNLRHRSLSFIVIRYA